jgi:hypothetical protein
MDALATGLAESPVTLPRRSAGACAMQGKEHAETSAIDQW